jgi:hypothetical protein
MTQLTYKEIEELQHIINTAMFELDDIPTNLYSLKLKLIKMRAELESIPKPKREYIGYSFHDDENRNIY